MSEKTEKNLQALTPSTPDTRTNTNSPIAHPTSDAPKETHEFFMRRFPTLSLCLENSGSVARDHLASERTFLAYVRTSLAVVSIGVVLVQLFTVSASNPSPALSAAARKIQSYAPELGATIIIFGLLVQIIGTIRFFSIQFALIKGKFPTARVLVASISIGLSVLTLIVFGILVAGHR